MILAQYIAICGKNFPMLTLTCPHEQSIIKTHLSSLFLRDHVDDSTSFATNLLLVNKQMHAKFSEALAAHSQHIMYEPYPRVPGHAHLVGWLNQFPTQFNRDHRCSPVQLNYYRKLDLQLEISRFLQSGMFLYYGHYIFTAYISAILAKFSSLRNLSITIILNEAKSITSPQLKLSKGKRILHRKLSEPRYPRFQDVPSGTRSDGAKSRGLYQVNHQ